MDTQLCTLVRWVKQENKQKAKRNKKQQKNKKQQIRNNK
jgi:hypothetical protein